MSERWKTYIVGGVERGGGPVAFALTQWAFLFPVFLAIRRALPSGGRVLDVGCGAAIFSSLLAHHGYDVTGIDEDPDIVQYAREMIEYLRSPARVEQATASDLRPYHGRFDLVYSLGVVEHADADGTVELLREQFRCAPIVAAAVPSRHTHYAAPITDERLYSHRQFARLIRRAGGRVRESFVYGDLPTRLALNSERLLPGVLDRAWRRWATYGMGICCVGERAREGAARGVGPPQATEPGCGAEPHV